MLIYNRLPIYKCVLEIYYARFLECCFRFLTHYIVVA